MENIVLDGVTEHAEGYVVELEEKKKEYNYATPALQEFER